MYITWAVVNRSDLVRVPAYQPGKESAVRVEYRSPDPACNPYLAFAVMLEAGLEGIDGKCELPPPSEQNAAEMTEAERREAGIQMLPQDLSQAIDLAEGGELVRRVLGDHLFEKYLENKKMDWSNYRAQVTGYELEQHLTIL